MAYVIDVASGGAVACRTLNILKDELELYLPGLSRRGGCIVANKMDGGVVALQAVESLIDMVGDSAPVFPVSAKYGAGIDDVVDYMASQIV